MRQLSTLHVVQSIRRLYLAVQLNNLYYYLRGFSCLDSSFCLFKNALTPLCLSRDKTKGQFGKNTTLTPTKILSKK